MNTVQTMLSKLPRTAYMLQWIVGGLLLGGVLACRPTPSADTAAQRSSSAVDSSAQPSSPARQAPPGTAARAPGQVDGGQVAPTGTNQLPEGQSAEGQNGPRATTPRPLSQAAGANAASDPPATPAASTIPATADGAGGRPWRTATNWPYEFWEAQYLNSNRIGVTHYQIDKTDDQRLMLTAKTMLQVQRGSEIVRQSISVQSIERADGLVDSFFEEMQGNGTTTKSEGSITDRKLVLKTTSGGKVASTVVAWPDGTWGPMGVYQLLLRQPMRSGESRQAAVFLPQIHKVARVTLTAGQIEDTTSPEGLLHALLPIDVQMQLEDQGIMNRMWVNAQGEVMKTVMTSGPNISSFRVARADAERLESQGLVDVLSATSIPLESPLDDPENAQKIVYEVECKNQDPYTLLSRESNQAVRSRSAFSATVTVWRPTPNEGLPPVTDRSGPDQTPPTAECSSPSLMIQSDDAAVAKMAAALGGDAKPPLALAEKLTAGVFRAIKKKNFSRGFDSAQEVARTLEGDCTEHAVLLTALLRNRGIPARIASGLVATKATDGQSIFAYHMWTEAWLGDRWLPLDATLGGVAGCGHIKFLVTPLSESNPYGALLPVLSSLGQLSISVGDINR